MGKVSIPKLHKIKWKGRENVEILDVATLHDIPVERVIVGALEERLKSVIVIGVYPDEREFFASSMTDMAQVVWYLERMKKRSLERADE